MKRRFGVAAVILSAVSAIAWAMPMPVDAATVSAIVGSGTIFPGIPGPTGGTVANSVSFSGTGVGIFNTTGVGTCSLSVSASGTDSTALGSGSGMASCNGTSVLGSSISIQCIVSYTRVGTIIIWIIAGCGTGAWVCIWVFTNVNPATAYFIDCVIVTV